MGGDDGGSGKRVGASAECRARQRAGKEHRPPVTFPRQAPPRLQRLANRHLLIRLRPFPPRERFLHRRPAWHTILHVHTLHP